MEILHEILAAIANREVILGFFILSIGLFQAAMLMQASRDDNKNFDLLDIIRGPDRRVSSAKVVQMMCLEPAIWAFVLYAFQGKLDQLGIWWFLLIVIGIGSPAVNKIIDAYTVRIVGLLPEQPPAPQPAPVPAPLSPGAVRTTTEVGGQPQ